MTCCFVSLRAVLHRTGRTMTSGLSWGHYLCPIAFFMTRGTFSPPPPSPNIGNVTHDGAESLKHSVTWQVHFPREHGQHLPQPIPPEGGREGGDTIQASLPPGERGRGAEQPRLMTYLHLWMLEPGLQSSDHLFCWKRTFLSRFNVAVGTRGMWWEMCFSVFLSMSLFIPEPHSELMSFPVAE